MRDGENRKLHPPRRKDRSDEPNIYVERKAELG